MRLKGELICGLRRNIWIRDGTKDKGVISGDSWLLTTRKCEISVRTRQFFPIVGMDMSAYGKFGSYALS